MKKKSNEIIKEKTYIKSTSQTQTIPSKSTKSHTKQRSHSSPIHPQKTIQGILNLFSKRQELIKEKPKASIDQFRKTHINIKVNKERPGSTFKLSSAKFDRNASTSRIKTPRINNQCNAQGSAKSLYRSYSVQTMDIKSDNINVNLKLADM